MSREDDHFDFTKQTDDERAALTDMPTPTIALASPQVPIGLVHAVRADTDREIQAAATTPARTVDFGEVTPARVGPS